MRALLLDRFSFIINAPGSSRVTDLGLCADSVETTGRGSNVDGFRPLQVEQRNPDTAVGPLFKTQPNPRLS